MITINLTADDLVNMRFAYNPLLEIPFSHRLLRNPALQTPHQRWVDEARRALHDVEFPYLEAVLPALRACTPEFLTPTPLSNGINVEDAFTDVLATPNAVISKNIQKLIAVDGGSEIRHFFLAHPREAIHCLVEEMRVYWRRTLAHYWSWMMSAMERDMLYRGRTLALEGPAKLFEELHSTIAFQQDKLQIQPTPQTLQHDREVHLNGHGIQLVPTIFSGFGRYLQIVPDSRLMLAYCVRGVGLWYKEQPDKNRSLELALGVMRARVLRTLQVPATTSELAYKLHLAAGTVSVHLARLSKAGLIEPRRLGKRVYYHLTERGQHLIALFDTTD